MGNSRGVVTIALLIYLYLGTEKKRGNKKPDLNNKTDFDAILQNN